ncbi:MAG: DUF2865 domain-containing protein [Rhizobiales bacterium]|nr:DUF2865 domain-containing protein [Hyphomicrobiales bacterium]
MSCLRFARHGHHAVGRCSSPAFEFGTLLALVLAMLVALVVGGTPAAAQSGGFFSLFQSKPARPPARVVRVPEHRRVAPGRIIRVGPNGRVLSHGGYRIVVGPDGSRRIFKPFAEASRQRGYLDGSDAAGRQSLRPEASRSGGYRTVCVRLCDGYYFPLSHGVSSSAFRRDRNRCDAACGNSAAMFVTWTGNDDVARWRDLNGNTYGDLKNAFRYRRERVAGCQCKPEPWSRDARIRHARFAAVEDGSSLSDVRVREARVIDNPQVRVTPLQIVPGRAVPSGQGDPDDVAETVAAGVEGSTGATTGEAASGVETAEHEADAAERIEAGETELALRQAGGPVVAAEGGVLPESWRATDPLLSAHATGEPVAAEDHEARRRAFLMARQRGTWRLEQGHAGGTIGYAGRPRYATPALSGARPVVAPVKSGAPSTSSTWRRNWQAARD